VVCKCSPRLLPGNAPTRAKEALRSRLLADLPPRRIPMIEPQKPNLGRPRGRGPERATAIALKGSQEWKKWLDELAAHCRLGLADTVEPALIDYAEKQGFPKPPKR
jgi:hypothetical protein